MILVELPNFTVSPFISTPAGPIDIDETFFEIGNNFILNELETDLYTTIENQENPDDHILFAIDKVLLKLCYKISSKNILFMISDLIRLCE